MRASRDGHIVQSLSAFPWHIGSPDLQALTFLLYPRFSFDVGQRNRFSECSLLSDRFVMRPPSILYYFLSYVYLCRKLRGRRGPRKSSRESDTDVVDEHHDLRVVSIGLPNGCRPTSELTTRQKSAHDPV